MERTEELVQNLLIAQNELILHLNILKHVPDLARVLFGSVEKNSTPEKNSDPEKNSSEMEKIRQTWMDDVVGLASEFYINEEAFNLENLSELLKATIGAITDILELGPEENSVDQTEKRKITLRDVVKVRFPDSVSPEHMGGVEYCPGDYNLPHICYCHNGFPSEQLCQECWDQEYRADLDNQAENWTCIDQLAKYHPEFVNEKYVGGAFECPITHGYNAKCLCVEKPAGSTIEADALCRQCWKQPYKPQV